MGATPEPHAKSLGNNGRNKQSQLFGGAGRGGASKLSSSPADVLGAPVSDAACVPAANGGLHKNRALSIDRKRRRKKTGDLFSDGPFVLAPPLAIAATRTKESRSANKRDTRPSTRKRQVPGRAHFSAQWRPVIAGIQEPMRTLCPSFSRRTIHHRRFGPCSSRTRLDLRPSTAARRCAFERARQSSPPSLSHLSPVKSVSTCSEPCRPLPTQCATIALADVSFSIFDSPARAYPFPRCSAVIGKRTSVRRDKAPLISCTHRIQAGFDRSGVTAKHRASIGHALAPPFSRLAQCPDPRIIIGRAGGHPSCSRGVAKTETLSRRAERVSRAAGRARTSDARIHNDKKAIPLAI